MIRNQRTSQIISACLELCVFVAASQLRIYASDEMEQRLQSQYREKILILRGFYQGTKLIYDSAGMPTGSPVSGDWTVNGFVRVNSLTLSSQRLAIQADRLVLVNDGHAFGFHADHKKKAKKVSRLRIDADLDPGGITAEKLNALLSKIFLNSQDRFADLVPAYWRPCISAASGKGANIYSACTFPPELAAIPGLISNLADEKATEADAKAPDVEVVPIRKGVTPPKPRSTPEPDFPDEAQKLGYHGVIMLMVVVDKTGQTRDIRIVRPLGMGLDQRAVDTVARWQFSPAQQDGQPVSVELAIEVDFHLYH